MADYVVKEGDRLDALILRRYGEVSDRAALTLALANQDAWTGRLPEVGETIQLPDAISPDVPDRVPSPFAAATFVSNPDAFESADRDDGSAASDVTAIEQAAAARILSVRGDRWFSPGYGSFAVPVALGATMPADAASIRNAVEEALSRDEDWYEAESISLSDGSDLGLDVRVVLRSVSDSTPVYVEVTL